MIFITREEKKALKQTYKMLELSKPKFALAVLAGTISISSGTALNAVSAWLIAQASKMPPVLSLTVATVSVRLFGITKPLFRYAERLLSHETALKGINSLRENIYKKLSSSPIDCVAHIKRGDLFTRASSDIESVGNYVIKSILPFYIAIFSSLVPILVTLFILPEAAVTLAIGLAISGIIAPLLTIKATRIAQLTLDETQTTLVTNTMTIMESGSELIINNQDEKLFDILLQNENKVHKLKNKVAKLNATATAVDTIGLFFALVSAIILGIPAVASGEIKDINLAVITLLPLASFESISMLKPASIQLITSANSALRIMQLLDKGNEEAKKEILKNTPENITLNLENLDTGWNGKTLIKNINFKITAGSKIAIVGQSGIGKSTLLYTLSGMLQSTNGKLLLNNVTINEENRQNLAKYITLITEDSHIFQTSIYENIRVVDNNITEEQAYSYLVKAGLKPWIDSIPDGIHTQLIEGANSISGGQRRRILLARCYATKTPIILIDEPNEHLDPATTDELVKDIFDIAQTKCKIGDKQIQRSVIVVTHRLTPLEKADFIVMLEKEKTESKKTNTNEYLNEESTLEKTIVKHLGTHFELIKKSPEYSWKLKQENQ